jgi:hypothetical protein
LLRNLFELSSDGEDGGKGRRGLAVVLWEGLLLNTWEEHRFVEGRRAGLVLAQGLDQEQGLDLAQGLVLGEHNIQEEDLVLVEALQELRREEGLDLEEVHHNILAVVGNIPAGDNILEEDNIQVEALQEEGLVLVEERLLEEVHNIQAEVHNILEEVRREVLRVVLRVALLVVLLVAFVELQDVVLFPSTCFTRRRRFFFSLCLTK